MWNDEHKPQAFVYRKLAFSSQPISPSKARNLCFLVPGAGNNNDNNDNTETPGVSPNRSCPIVPGDEIPCKGTVDTLVEMKEMVRVPLTRTVEKKE